MSSLKGKTLFISGASQGAAALSAHRASAECTSDITTPVGALCNRRVVRHGWTRTARPVEANMIAG
jgi:hypothetical protein